MSAEQPTTVPTQTLDPYKNAFSFGDRRCVVISSNESYNTFRHGLCYRESIILINITKGNVHVEASQIEYYYPSHKETSGVYVYKYRRTEGKEVIQIYLASLDKLSSPDLQSYLQPEVEKALSLRSLVDI
jgi:hypothetical protein